MVEETRRALMEAAERFGVPVVILAAFLWMAREAATSVHTSVVVPIVESHTKFLEETSRTQSQQAETLRELAVGQKEIHSHLLKATGSK